MADEIVVDTEVDPGLESKVNAGLSALQEIDDEPVESVEGDEPAGEEAPGEEEIPAEEVEAPADKGGKSPEKTSPAKVTPAPASVIPPAHVRSLKAYQWTDEEIAAAYKADPANFLRTAAKLHDTRNEETRRMSILGTAAKKPATPAETTEKKAREAFKGIDTAALRKTYGNEPFIDALETMSKMLAEFDGLVPAIHGFRENQQQSEQAALTQQIDGFFGSAELAPYSDSYGKAGALTQEHYTARQKVIEYADLIIGGARQMGRPITLDEALTLAHDAVSGPVRTEAVRKEIKQQIQTRHKAVTLKPGKRGGQQTASGPKALETSVGTGLKSVFG